MIIHRIRKECIGIMCLIVVSLIISGCWDMRELQNRGFVMAVGIDVADDVKAKETFVQPVGSKVYRLSVQVLKLAPAGETGPKGRATEFFVISSTGQSMHEMIRDMLGQTAKGLYFEHLQAIVISDEAVKVAGLKPVIDLFTRDSEMRWRIKVFITPGRARDFMEYKPPTGESGGMYLAGIIQNHKKNLHVGGSVTDLGNIVQLMDNKKPVRIPRIELADKVLKASGFAVFNEKDKFIGYFDEYSVQGQKFIMGTEKSGIITRACKDHPNEILAFEIFRHDTKLTPHVEGDKIYFTLDITMYGNLGEVTCGKRHDTLDPKYLREAEVAFAEEVHKAVEYAHRMCQEHKVDINNFGGKLAAYEPDTWEKIKDRWKEIFPTVPLYTSVNVIIRGVGEHR